jgi:hypothetical protein
VIRQPRRGNRKLKGNGEAGGSHPVSREEDRRELALGRLPPEGFALLLAAGFIPLAGFLIPLAAEGLGLLDAEISFDQLEAMKP